jgi:hypothetical protein
MVNATSTSSSDCDDVVDSSGGVDRAATVRVIACFIAGAIALVATLVVLSVRARRRKLLAAASASAGGHRASPSAVSGADGGWFAVWGPDGRQHQVAVRCDDDDAAPDVVVVVDK